MWRVAEHSDCYVTYPRSGIKKNRQRTWYEARNRCLRLNGDLAEMKTNFNELDWLDKDMRYWIGLQRDPLVMSLPGTSTSTIFIYLSYLLLYFTNMNEFTNSCYMLFINFYARGFVQVGLKKLEKMAVGMHCNLKVGSPYVAPVVLRFNYNAHYAPESNFNTFWRGGIIRLKYVSRFSTAALCVTIVSTRSNICKLYLNSRSDNINVLAIQSSYLIIWWLLLYTISCCGLIN